MLNMKKFLLRLGAVAVALVLMAVLASPALAAAKTVTWVVASTSGVNLRKTASASGKVLGALGLGSTIEVSKTSKDKWGDTWGYVESSKKATGSWGTIKGGWVNLAPCCKGTPSKWTTTAKVNIRKSADATSKSMGLLPKNSKLTVTTIKKAGGYTWGFVAYAKDPGDIYYMREGWVALEYCKKG